MLNYTKPPELRPSATDKLGPLGFRACLGKPFCFAGPVQICLSALSSECSAKSPLLRLQLSPFHK